MASKANPFASLASDSSDNSDSDVDDVTMLPTQPEQHIVSHGQSGGDILMRVDPLVAANASLTDIGFTDEELQACIKVVKTLSANEHLFKLSQLRPLRQALAPLVELQLEGGGYAADAKSNANNKRKNDRGGRGNNKKRARDEAAATLTPAQKLKDMEREYINQTQLRAIRLAQLEKLNESQSGSVSAVAGALTNGDDNSEGVDTSNAQLVYRVPDGVGSSSVKNSIYKQIKAQRQLEDGSASASAVSTGGALVTVGGATGRVRVCEEADDQLMAPRGPAIELSNPLSCYICRKPFRTLHFFYAQLCPDCAAFNYVKRDEIVNMVGKVCFVTGARAKIGFRCALKLLRCGATVIATTRFPVAAAEAFLEEPDSDDWKGRLHIYGLDFRNLAVLEKFLQFVNYTYSRLDAIVNNACQTVRRPPAYYTRMMASERTKWEDLGLSKQAMLAPYRLFLGHLTHDERAAYGGGDDDIHEQQQQGCSSSNNKPASDANANPTEVVSEMSDAGAQAVLTNPHKVSLPQSMTYAEGSYFSSAESSQLALLASDKNHTQDKQNFPTGLTDVNGAQVDLRNQNSWTLRLHEVSTSELAEVMAINAMAPALINARLKGLMEKSLRIEGRGPNGAPMSTEEIAKSKEPEWKFVVNVSAMEGKFYRFKTQRHPHTNMAKASLNMMTRTSSSDYVSSHIYMTAVDTGWINDEKPLEAAVKHEKQHNFQTPIDEIDAAARVLDPIIGPLLSRSKGEMTEPPFGIFLKDFVKCEW